MRKWVPSSSASTLVLLATLSLAMYFAFAAGQRSLQMYHMQQERARLERDISALQARQRGLLEQKQHLLNSQDIEGAARRQLDLVKPGDIAVIVIPETTSPEPAPPTPEPPPDTRPFWRRWFDALGGQ